MREAFVVRWPAVLPVTTEGDVTKTHHFIIVASGMDMPSRDSMDRFYEAGCDDATIAMQRGLVVLEFDRDARTFTSALVSAYLNVIRAGATVERIEPDHLVSAQDIARRSHLSKASISLYAKGERGRDFPRPVARIMTDTPLYDWVDVSTWLYHRGRLPLTEVVRAKVVRELNKLLEKEHAGKSFILRTVKDRQTKLLAAA